MSDSNAFSRKLGLDGSGPEALSWWGCASPKTRAKARALALIVASITFFIFNWLLQDQSISRGLVALIVATLTALNIIQAWERSTVKNSIE